MREGGRHRPAATPSLGPIVARCLLLAASVNTVGNSGAVLTVRVQDGDRHDRAAARGLAVHDVGSVHAGTGPELKRLAVADRARRQDARGCSERSSLVVVGLRLLLLVGVRRLLLLLELLQGTLLLQLQLLVVVVVAGQNVPGAVVSMRPAE